MEYLYSPWRSQYFCEDHKNGCIFCEISKDVTEKHFVFYSDEICYGVMNLYPYTPGHLMLIPHRHIDSPNLLLQEEWIHISSLVPNVCEMLYAFGATGINTGINIKEAGGAGIPQHLHWHFVPRFERDTNFMTSIAQTRVYGREFNEIFAKIKKLANQYLQGGKQ